MRVPARATVYEGVSRPAANSNRVFGIALFSLISLHLGLLFYFAPPATLLSKQPVMTVDYALHVYQVDRAWTAFNQHGALWAWDPLALAGQPAGVVEDLTSKGTELFVIGLGRLGVSRAFAFNLFILLVHLGLPLTAWLVGRLLALGRWETLVLHALWLSLWFFDSFMHWSWWIGMITWSFSSYGAVLLVALLYRCLEAPTLGRFAWLALLAAVLSLVHPFVVLSLAIPCIALYARSFRGMSGRAHAMLAAAALVAASTALIWIFPFLRFKHYVGDVDTFFNATLSFALYDAFDLLKDGRQTGGPVRTMFRMLCFAAGAVMLLRWHRAGDRRALGLSSLVLSALALAYGSAYFWLGRQTQPYRHIGPAMFAAAVPAAVLLRELLSPSALRSYPRGAQVALMLCAVLVAPRAARTALQYMPSLLPEQVQRSKLDFLSSPLVGLNEPKPLVMRHEGPLPQHRAVRSWLLKHHAGGGRVVPNDWVLGEYLAASTNVPILGGILERNVPHVDANLFRRAPDGDLSPAELAAYFENYAVEYVILTGGRSPLDERPELLRPVTAVAGYRIYQTVKPPSYFERGSGKVRSQAVNEVELSDVQGDVVVLRFHWMETLRCRPDCSVERAPNPLDRVGFIRVDKPPANFEIYNGY